MTAPDSERVLRHTTRRDAPPTPQCLSDDTIAALADGALDQPSRARALAHVGECARCRTAVASVSRALRDPSVASEIRHLGGKRSRFLRIALPAAAAAIIVVLALPLPDADVGSQHRAPTITAVSSPVPTAPLGIVADVTTLRWSSVRGADRYRATLFDDAGGVVYETQTADTMTALPDSITLTRTRSYLWKVEARTGWGRWSASELVEFSVR